MATYRVVSEQDSHMQIDVYAGANLYGVIDEAINLAKLHEKDVRFNFNGINVNVTPSSTSSSVVSSFERASEERATAYKNSPEGKQAVIDAANRQKSAQTAVDDMLENFEIAAAHPDTLIEWLGAFSEVNDHIGLTWDRKGLISRLNDLGYKSNDCVGNPLVATDKVVFAKWLVGQCIETLNSMGSIHPIAHKFANDYKEKFGNNDSTSLSM